MESTSPVIAGPVVCWGSYGSLTCTVHKITDEMVGSNIVSLVLRSKSTIYRRLGERVLSFKEEYSKVIITINN